MKTLRRSLNSNRDTHPQISAPVPVPQLQKPSAAIAPPKKVIKASDGYRPQAPQELGFQKGDFFYVVKDPEPDDAWYQVHNPVTGARGIVPRNLFEEFNKANAALRASTRAGPRPLTSTPTAQKTQAFYAVVLHDFIPERPDELDARAGDPISVVAQSNREWFVAKPIGRLGRPGLIPVSFVEIRDPVTNLPLPDVNAIMDRGELPKVEEWKRAVLNYKASTIPLGVLEDNTSPVPNSPFMPSTPFIQEHQFMPPSVLPTPPEPEPPRSSSPTILPEGILVSAEVVSFHHEADEFWFRVNAVFQPRDPSGSVHLAPARQLVLYRVYNDFYDFQVELLKTFPREAGREPPNSRILPYMPGPADVVDHAVTVSRRAELDEYLRLLCALHRSEAGYILEHQLVRDFFSPKPGDVETDLEPTVQEQTNAGQTAYNDRGFQAQESISEEEPVDLDPLADDGYQDGYDDEIQSGMGQMRLNDQDDQGSEGSQYDDEAEHHANGHSYGSPGRLQAQNHDRSDSTSSYFSGLSPVPARPNPPPGSRSPLPDSADSQYSYPYQTAPKSALARLETDHESRRPDSSSRADSMASYPSTPASTGSRTQSNNPPISANNAQTAFIKIKIFDRLTDDLIAIRVSPRVTHAQLIEKVQARLGGDVQHLKYRDSVQNGFVGIDDDRALHQWLEYADKHVLYVD